MESLLATQAFSFNLVNDLEGLWYVILLFQSDMYGLDGGIYNGCIQIYYSSSD